MDEKDFFVTASLPDKHDPTGRYKEVFLPTWFNKKANCFIPQMTKAFIQKKIKTN